MNDDSAIAVRGIRGLIVELRGQKVILDSDLARLYGVPAKRLNEQVRRNVERFPLDFAFQLTPKEAAELRSQFTTPILQHVDDECPEPMRSQIATA
jgi:hypothetical protein